MTRRLSFLASVVLFLAWPGQSLPGRQASDPHQSPTPETADMKTAANGNELLVPQPVVPCGASGTSPDAGDPATTSAIPRIDRFIAAEHFREALSPSVVVKIAWLGAMFRQRFLNKVEDDRGGGALLRRFALRRSSQSAGIVAELTIHHETRLADVWCLLSRQPNGEPGVLLTDAIPNIFYIRDADDALRAVDAVWSGAGWEIGASAVDGSYLWPPGSLVIAR